MILILCKHWHLKISLFLGRLSRQHRGFTVSLTSIAAITRFNEFLQQLRVASFSGLSWRRNKHVYCVYMIQGVECSCCLAVVRGHSVSNPCWAALHATGFYLEIPGGYLLSLLLPPIDKSSPIFTADNYWAPHTTALSSDLASKLSQMSQPGLASKPAASNTSYLTWPCLFRSTYLHYV